MSFFSTVLSPFETPAARTGARKPGLFSVMLAAMMQARQRQAEREIARYIALNGGKLTDSMERDIEQRVLAPRR